MWRNSILRFTIVFIFMMASITTSARKEAIHFAREQFKSNENIDIFSKAVGDLLAGDFNGDSRPDIAAIIVDKIKLFINIDGHFPDNVDIATDLQRGMRMSAADLDNDGDLDIVFTDNGFQTITVGNVNILINDGRGNFMREVLDPYYVGAKPVTTVDLDRDGDADIMVAGNFWLGLVMCKLCWYENIGNLQFFKHEICSILQGANDIDVGDIDGDGDGDIVLGAMNAVDFCWFENDGHQSFTRRDIETTQDIISFCPLSDVNQDGLLDIVMATDNNPEELLWLENDGKQNFIYHLICSGYEGPKQPSVVDLDSDGDLDIISGFYPEGVYSEGHDFVWFENCGAEHFTMRTIEPYFDGIISHCTADVNNDGRIDIIGGNDLAGLAWWENQPNIGVNLSMPSSVYSKGDTFSLQANLYNYSLRDMSEIPLFVLLDVHDEYWFWPSWTPEVNYRLVDIPRGTRTMEIIEPFHWPDNLGQDSGILFLGTFLKKDFSKILGTYDYIAFGWQ